jgi:hypothetical protein
MAISRAQINWGPVSFNAVPITRVTTAGFGLGGTLLKMKADVDLFPTLIACADIEPHGSVTTADVGPMMALAPGSTGTLIGQLNDAKGVSLGGVVFTMTNAVFENADASGAHAAFGTVTGTWQGFSTDGVTPPLIISRI